MATMHSSLTSQLLEWIAEKPRTYAELMQAWKTSCPRLWIWEDECAGGLLELDSSVRAWCLTGKKRRCLEVRAVAGAS
jgi:hypothetical protein